MKLENLTVGERFIVDWQYGMMGGFNTALKEAIISADEGNLGRLAKGFPDEVFAYMNFTRVDRWWQNLQKKIRD